MLDFTLEKYNKLCKAIVDSDYIPMSVRTFLEDQQQKCVILRHDVDRKPEQAMKVAEIEKDHGISSTYYFRTVSDVFKPDIIRAINDSGHEIGYHYEVLDRAKGDFKKAIKIFEDELKEFRKLCDLKTICMHGNPLSSWDNRDLWKKYNFKDFDIIGEPYLSIDYEKVLYLTDTGRTWNSSKYSVKDVVGVESIYQVKSTDDVIDLLKNEVSEQICISTHPERWSDNFGSWVKDLIWQNVKNVGKAGIVKYRTSFHD
ncbi:MAG: hypothetical protein SCAL_001385 [Candidatus Syntrophoarchaeum caldarius]|uniref:Polysaccharide deacetylase n=1 Tax=Candidatus Syntropharchaeum caldarium TaxID=1838285 RepID=A0A1F2P7X0_9EURY|nr:MAG: hypothetical protein SCAL_001385 [Candidatus Syntrophoarchaeum caldarius]